MLLRFALVFVILWGLGCATISALEQGHALVAERQYRAAVEAYRRALAEDPEDEEAQRALAQILPYAVEQGQQDTAQAVRDGRWEEAVDHAGYVASLDPERGAALRAEVLTLLRASLEALLLAGEMDRAYPLAVRARRIEPQLRGLNDAFERLRQHYLAESERLADAGQYAGALAALDTIDRHEPHLRGWLAPRKRAVRVRWADATVALATSAEAEGRVGEAAAYYARAFEIADRAADGDAMRRLLRELRQEGLFWLSLAVDAASPRLPGLVETRALAIEGVALIDDRQGSVMTAHAVAEPLRCDQNETSSRASQEYIASYRDVSNPAWEELDREIAALGTRVSSASHSASRSADEAARLRRAARQTQQRECLPAERALGDAERALEEASARVREQRERVASLERSGDHEAARQARQRLSELEAEERAAQREADEARRRRDQAGRSCDEASRRADRAQSEAAEARAALASAQAELSVLERRRDATPRTVSEPVYDTFYYDVRHVTRRCGGLLALSMDRAWSSPLRVSLSGDAEVRDDTHPGYARYGVDEDPLELGRSDAALRAEAEETLAGKVAAALLEQVSDFYRQMAQRALDESDTETSTATMLALHAAAPSHIPDVQRAAFAERLHRRYGLESIATLAR